MKPTFLNHEKPLLTCMIQEEIPVNAISQIRTAVSDGADAIGFQIEKLKPEFRTEDEYKNIFYFADEKPIYITNYRRDGYDFTDEQLVEQQLVAIKAGATMCDLMGDLFNPSPLEFATDKTTIDKQKKAVDKIHSAGGEVLMSSHTMCFLEKDRVLEILSGHQERGADIAKIVTASNTEEELMENIKTSIELKKEMKIPFLFLSVGPYCKLHRNIGPYVGSCMWLCVPEYTEFATKDQPLLRNIKKIKDNVEFLPHGRDNYIK